MSKSFSKKKNCHQRRFFCFGVKSYQMGTYNCYDLLIKQHNHISIRGKREKDFYRGKEEKNGKFFFCILLQVHDVLSDRRVIKSQTTAGTMTLVLYDRVPSNFSVVCKIKRTSVGDEYSKLEEFP